MNICVASENDIITEF